MRILPWLSVLVCGGACSPSAPVADIFELVPAEISVGELPAEVLVNGENFYAQLEVTLDDPRPGKVTEIRAAFGDTEVLEMDHLSRSQLRLQVPEGLSPGFYDLTLSVGTGWSVVKASALEVRVWPKAGKPEKFDSRDGGVTDAPEPPDASVNVEREPPDASVPEGAVDAGGAERLVDGAVVGGDERLSDAAGAGPSADDERCGATEFGAPKPVVLGGFRGGLPWGPSLSADGLVLFFGGTFFGREEIWSASRGDRDELFSGAAPVESLVRPGNAGTPFISFDGLSLYFYSENPAETRSRELYVAHRGDVGESFAPRELAVLNSNDLDHMPWVSDDELQIVFVSGRGLAMNVWRSTRADKSSAFGPPSLLKSLSSAAADGRVYITPDGRRAYFSSSRGGGRGRADLWVATRALVTDEFSNPTNVEILNTAERELDPTLSRDGKELYFVRQAGAGGTTLLRAVANCNDGSEGP